MFEDLDEEGLRVIENRIILDKHVVKTVYRNFDRLSAKDDFTMQVGELPSNLYATPFYETSGKLKGWFIVDSNSEKYCS